MATTPARGSSIPSGSLGVAAGAIASAASALLTALILAPWDLWWFTPGALAPFLLAIRGRSPREGALLGLVWGVVHHWATAYWMLPAIADYYAQPWWFAFTFGAVSSIVYRGVPYAALGAVLAIFTRSFQGAALSLLAGAAWVTVELARARGPSEDPWLLLGYALLPFDTLRQSASLGGPYLLSFLVVLGNTTVLAVATAAWRRTPSPRADVGVALVALVAALCFGAYQGSRPARGRATVVTLVQGNNDFGAQWEPDYYGRGLEPYLALARSAAADRSAELMIWPESALTFFLAHEEARQRRVLDLLAAIDNDLIVGAPHFTSEDPAIPDYLNSAFYVTAQQGITDRYDKITLLPFAEYYPLQLGAWLRREFAPVRSFSPGESVRTLGSRFGPLAVAVCFEAVHSDAVRQRSRQGAVALVNLSNDGWLGRGPGPAQHFAMARLRAIENDTWLLRATTTGFTAVVDPRGRVTAAIAPWRQGHLTTEVRLRSSSTVYQRWGDWWGFLCVAATVGGLLNRRVGRSSRSR